MTLVTSFEFQLQAFRVAFTQQSFSHLISLLTGWVLCRRRTVTNMLVAAGVAGQRHHSIFHRFFSTAKWSLDRVGMLVFGMLEPHLSGTCLLSLDDTLAHKRGRQTYGAGMHRDPLLSSPSHAVTTWGHNWVVLAVILRFPLWPERALSLPVLARLYLNKKAAAKWQATYQTRSELALEMLRLLCNSRKNRRFHVIADCAYGGQQVLLKLPANCDLTSGLHLRARLHQAPPTEFTCRAGRPRVRGERVPSPVQMLQQKRKRWKMQLYGRKQEVEFVDTTAYLYCAPNRPVKIVAVQPLHAGCKQRAFYSTCHDATAEQVLTWYAQRWSLEVTFHDTKQHLGFEDPPGWTRGAVERTAPLALLLYSLIVLWYVQYAAHRKQWTVLPWYRTKQTPSFRDMLLALRRESLEESILSLAPEPMPFAKLQKTLHYLIEIAA